jgi:hypothetical protein
LPGGAKLRIFEIARGTARSRLIKPVKGSRRKRGFRSRALLFDTLTKAPRPTDPAARRLGHEKFFGGAPPIFIPDAMSGRADPDRDGENFREFLPSVAPGGQRFFALTGSTGEG